MNYFIKTKDQFKLFTEIFVKFTFNPIFHLKTLLIPLVKNFNDVEDQKAEKYSHSDSSQENIEDIRESVVCDLIRLWLCVRKETIYKGYLT